MTKRHPLLFDFQDGTMAGNDQQHPPPQGAPKGAHAPKTPPKMPPKVMPLTPKVMQPAPPMPAHDGPMPSAGHVAPSGEQAAAGGGPQGQGQCPKWFRLVQDVDILGTELGSLQESDPGFVINLGVLWSRFIDS